MFTFLLLFLGSSDGFVTMAVCIVVMLVFMACSILTHHIVAPGFVDRPRRSDCTAGQMDGEAGWWTASGNIGLPPLARVMGVCRQQQHGLFYNGGWVSADACCVSRL